jgi:hypothetical protein
MTMMPSKHALSVLALLLLLGSMAACADKNMSGQRSQTQGDSMDSTMPPGDTPGGGGRY